MYTDEVADQLGLDPAAVSSQLARAKAALGTTSKLETVVRAMQLGLIAPPRRA
jgi:DNA-binding CsgD family transcriptional regulator